MYSNLNLRRFVFRVNGMNFHFCDKYHNTDLRKIKNGATGSLKVSAKFVLIAGPVVFSYGQLQLTE